MSASEPTTLRDQLARLGLAAQAGLVVGAVLAAGICAAPLAYALSGPVGVAAAAVAAGACLLGALLALVMAELLRGPAAALWAVAFGMLGRTVVPLTLGVTLHWAVPPLAAAGMIFYLLAFYLVGLTVETVLLVARASVTAADARKAV